jgi:hypothetical protein
MDRLLGLSDVVTSGSVSMISFGGPMGDLSEPGGTKSGSPIELCSLAGT